VRGTNELWLPFFILVVDRGSWLLNCMAYDCCFVDFCRSLNGMFLLIHSSHDSKSAHPFKNIERSVSDLICVDSMTCSSEMDVSWNVLAPSVASKCQMRWNRDVLTVAKSGALEYPQHSDWNFRYQPRGRFRSYSTCLLILIHAIELGASPLDSERDTFEMENSSHNAATTQRFIRRAMVLNRMILCLPSLVYWIRRRRWESA